MQELQGKVASHHTYTVMGVRPGGLPTGALLHVDGTKIDTKDLNHLGSEGQHVEKWPLVGVLLREPFPEAPEAARDGSQLLAAWNNGP